MGKGLLILIGVLAITGGTFMLGSVHQGSMRNTEQIGDYANKQTVREVAHTGMQDALMTVSQALQSSSTYSGSMNWAGSYQGGTYDNTLTISDSILTIVTTSVVDTFEYVLLREYEIESQTSTFLGAMGVALTSEETMDFEGEAVIASPWSETGRLNANIHSNGDINVGNSAFVCVFGFGFHGGSVAINNWQPLNGLFLPYQNPDSDPLTQLVPNISIPQVDATGQMGTASVTHMGDFTLSGTVTLGTEENPSFWYVDGDLTTSGPVTLEGYGIIMVKGDVAISHSVDASDMENEGVFAIYSEGEVSFNDSYIQFDGHLYANGNITTAYKTKVFGTMTTGTKFLFGTNRFDVYYVPPSSALMGPMVGGGGSATLALLSTREWAVH